MPKEKLFEYPHKYNSKEWEQAANNLARGFAPRIYPCKSCGSPVLSGYCCDFCGESDTSDEG